MRSFAYVELNEDSYQVGYKSSCAAAQSTQLLLKKCNQIKWKSWEWECRQKQKKWEYFRSIWWRVHCTVQSMSWTPNTIAMSECSGWFALLSLGSGRYISSNSRFMLSSTMQSHSSWNPRIATGRRNFLRFLYARTRTWIAYSERQMRFLATTMTSHSKRCWVKLCTFGARGKFFCNSASARQLCCNKSFILSVADRNWNLKLPYDSRVHWWWCQSRCLSFRQLLILHELCPVSWPIVSRHCVTLSVVINNMYICVTNSGTCERTLSECEFNGKKFDCCSQFIKIDTEIGRCYGLNSAQTIKPKKGFKELNMMSDQVSGPGTLRIKVMTECFLYTMGYYEVPNLVTPKTDILQIDQFIHYTWVLRLATTNIQLLYRFSFGMPPLTCCVDFLYTFCFIHIFSLRYIVAYSTWNMSKTIHKRKSWAYRREIVDSLMRTTLKFIHTLAIRHVRCNVDSTSSVDCAIALRTSCPTPMWVEFKLYFSIYSSSLIRSIKINNLEFVFSL